MGSHVCRSICKFLKVQVQLLCGCSSLAGARIVFRSGVYPNAAYNTTPSHRVNQTSPRILFCRLAFSNRQLSNIINLQGMTTYTAISCGIVSCQTCISPLDLRFTRTTTSCFHADAEGAFAMTAATYRISFLVFNETNSVVNKRILSVRLHICVA